MFYFDKFIAIVERNLDTTFCLLPFHTNHVHYFIVSNLIEIDEWQQSGK